MVENSDWYDRMLAALDARDAARRAASRVNREWHSPKLIAARKAALREAEAKVRELLSQARTRLKEE